MDSSPFRIQIRRREKPSRPYTWEIRGASETKCVERGSYEFNARRSNEGRKKGLATYSRAVLEVSTLMLSGGETANAHSSWFQLFVFGKSPRQSRNSRGPLKAARRALHPY